VEGLADYQRRALGSVLKAARLRMGWTQAEAGAQAKMARAYIAHIERGSKSPSMAVLTRYCAAMGVSPGDILIESRLAAPVEQGINPILLEGIRRLDPETQSRLAASWSHFERFVTSCLAANNSRPPGE
jgi:transcriptional regulator with XRE-family HTH domain